MEKAEAGRWLDLPSDCHLGLTGLCAAKARHLQDEASPALKRPMLFMLLDKIFSRLTAFSKEYRPGFVFGLTRHHRPESESWLEDARSWWQHLGIKISPGGPGSVVEIGEPEVVLPNPEKALNYLDGILEDEEPDRGLVCAEVVLCLKAGVRPDDPRLVKMLHPHSKLLTKEPKVKATRKAIRDFRKEMQEAGKKAEQDKTALPEDWPYWEYTRGKAAIIVGGETRVRVMKRIQKAFAFESIEWETSWNVRRNEAIASQVASGKIEVVIFLARFMSHQAWDIIGPSCKSAGTTSILVEQGYGVGIVRHTLESNLAGKLNGSEEAPGASK